MLKILIPTDFTVQPEFAYKMVQKLEEKIPVEVHFLHVLNAPETVTLNNGKIETCGEIDTKFLEHQLEIASRKLQDLKSVYQNKVETHLMLGKTTDTIVETAAEGNFDLIVTGTKGAWGVKEIFAGTETQMIVRKAKTPVLSLMCDRTDLTIENVLLVLDFEFDKLLNMQLLNKIVNAFNTKIHLLYINNNKKNEQEILENMNLFASENKLTNFKNHILNEKDIEKGVIHFNQMQNVDLVCLNHQTKKGLFSSNATEKLVNHMFKPIISFNN